MINKQEIRIVAVLSGIFALRMLGLSMLLPIFAIAASQYAYATPQLIGVAVGVYGLAQAVLQIPFGILSDKFGRKPLILIGLGFIMLGSLMSAWSTTIYGLVIGRLLQGCGSIGSVVIATLTDNVRSEVRASAMAILGASIGMSFALALVAGPWLYQLISLSGIFSVIFVLTLICGLLVTTIPNGTNFSVVKRKNSLLSDLQQALSGRLFAVHFGVFALHASLAATFLILPMLLQQSGIAAGKLWQLYLVVIFVAMLVAWRLIHVSETRKNIENLQLLAILGLLFAEGLLYIVSSWLGLSGVLFLFFSAFCILEASLPALVSKYASVNNRGAALGLYSCLQFLGVFIGGTVGGWIHGNIGVLGVLGFCVLLLTGWLLLTISNSKLFAKFLEQDIVNN